MPTRAAAVQGWARRKMKETRRKAGAAGDKAAIIRQIQKEAKEHGATLEKDGKGGVDPRIALEVFRRDKWRCSNGKCPTPKDKITLDHRAGHITEIVDDPDARKNKELVKGAEMGHIDDPDALSTLCAACHSRVHERENALARGDDPPPMRGDE